MQESHVTQGRMKWMVWIFGLSRNGQRKDCVFNTLTANYEITRRLGSLPGCQTTSYLVLTHIKKSTCRFCQIFFQN